MITSSITMKRVWSATPTRKLTKACSVVVQSTSLSAVRSLSPLGITNVRWVSNMAGDGPPVSLVLAIGAGMPIVLWTYKVGLSVVLGERVDAAGISFSVSCLSSSREKSYTWVRTNSFRFMGDAHAGVYRDVGYVPPGARTEEVSESMIPRGLRCEEIKISNNNRHSLSGVVVCPSSASRDTSRSSISASENPETLFFYLQGSNPLPREVYSLNDISRHRECRKPTPSFTRFQSFARSPLLRKPDWCSRRCAEIILEINAHSSF